MGILEAVLDRNDKYTENWGYKFCSGLVSLLSKELGKKHKYPQTVIEV